MVSSATDFESLNEAHPRTLVEMLAIRARGRRGHSLAIELRHHRSSAERITYRSLWRDARAASAQLRALDVRPGSRVLLVLPTGPEFITSIFGVMAAGAVPVPLALPFSMKKLDAYLAGLRSIAQDCGATHCITTERMSEVLTGALQGAADAPVRVIQPPAGGTLLPITVPALAPDDVALIQYTSGSTTRPRGVALTHANLLANISAFVAALDASDADVAVSWLPLYHDMGLIGMLFGSIYACISLVLMPPSAFLRDPGRWLRAISEHGATVTVAPNFAFDYCVKRSRDKDIAGLDLSSLRVALNGAEPVSRDAVAAFQARFAAAGLRSDVVRPVYGLAESSLAVTFSDPGPLRVDRIDADSLERAGQALRAAPGGRAIEVVSVGRPIATQEIRIVDDAGRAVRDRTIGEVVVRGPSVMSGYFGRPDETRRVLRDGWLHTGDLGYLAAGELHLTGRKKDLIIQRGRNYCPQDIEHVVSALDGMRSGYVAAFGIETGDDTRVVVVVETRSGDAHRRDELAETACAAIRRAFLLSDCEVLLVPPGTIPRTTSGKIRRQQCRCDYLRDELHSKPSVKASRASSVRGAAPVEPRRSGRRTPWWSALRLLQRVAATPAGARVIAIVSTAVVFVIE